MIYRCTNKKIIAFKIIIVIVIFGLGEAKCYKYVVNRNVKI